MNTKLKLLTKPVLRGQVRITKRYTCGCGMILKDEDEAIFHVQLTGHRVGIIGEVKLC